MRVRFVLTVGTAPINARFEGEGVFTYTSRAVGSTACSLVGVNADPAERGYVQ